MGLKEKMPPLLMPGTVAGGVNKYKHAAQKLVASPFAPGISRDQNRV